MSRPYRGVIVLAAPRSGTTLLHRLLDAHPAIACPPETSLFIGCASFVQEEPIASGPPLGVASGLWFSGFSEQVVLERVRDLAFGFLDEICARGKKRLWVEKTGSNGFYVDGIERVVGKSCRYVCLVRHGFDVAVSMREMVEKLGTIPLPLYRYVHSHRRPLEAYAHAWVDVCLRLRRFCSDNPEHALRIRYEDLVADPEAVVKELCEFLEEPGDAAAIVARAFEPREAQESKASVGLGDWKTYRTSGVHDASVGRWASVAKDQVGWLAEVLNPTLELEGYAPLPLGPDLGREEVLRRSKRAMLISGLGAEERSRGE